MKRFESPRGAGLWSPIATQNSWGEWAAALLVVAGSCWFMMAYHAWWRFKPYSLGTLNESLGLAGYYGIALAFALGPLHRFHLLPVSWVAWRRPLGIVAVVVAWGHAVVTLVPLWGHYGWSYLAIKHWDLTVLGLFNAGVCLWLLKTSLGNSVARLGPARWQSIQLCGLVVLPLILAHFMVLGKIPGWFDWFTGADPKPAPPGTLVAFVLGSAIIALRVADFLGHAQFQISRTGKNVA